VWTPRQTEWAKREAAPQTDDFEIGDSSSEETFGGDTEQPEVIETPDVEETDNKKRSPQVFFTVTDDLNYPIETETETYRPASTRRPSRTTTDRYGPYGSWYLTATGRHSVSTYHTRYTYNPYSTIETYSPYSAPTDTPDPDSDDPDNDDPNDDDPNDDSKATKRQVTYENDDLNGDDSTDDTSDDSSTETFVYNNGQETTDENGDDSTDTEIYVPTVPTVTTNNEDDGDTEDPDTADPNSDLESDNKKRALSPACNKRDGVFPCESPSVTSLIVKPSGLVEVSISRTIIQAGVSILLTSSSSSSSVAQTTFATSTRASKL